MQESGNRTATPPVVDRVGRGRTGTSLSARKEWNGKKDEFWLLKLGSEGQAHYRWIATDQEDQE